MLGKSTDQRIIESTAKVLRKARVLKSLSRKELAEKLNVTHKSIEKIENGRDKLSQERLNKILEAIGISKEEFLKLKRGKEITKQLRLKNVLVHRDRRSYKKIITKEAKVLKTLRRMKDISQDKASALCGYSRPTIGHIENGRIAIDRSRILHIISCYGFKYLDFERYLQVDNLRDEIIDQCLDKLKSLSDEKLGLIWGIIDSMSEKKSVN